ncbi:MAG: TIGR02391 family protein, partial [Lachnospiraceae bacterium]|nr:TIGR02391 family protein [Lachnospiraceae bacterium]
MQQKPLQIICDWVSKITRLPNFLQMPFRDNDVKSVVNNIIMLSNDIAKTEQYFSKELFNIKDSLFNGVFLNPIELGRLIEILNYLWSKQTNYGDDVWNAIHPRIIDVSKALFLNGHYSNAASSAFIEIIERTKHIYAIMHPGQQIPEGDSAITHVFSPNNPMLKICDTSNKIGEDYQRGIMELFKGANAAFRNTSTHTNKLALSKEEAIRRLMVASLLMYKIDEAVKYSGISEQNSYYNVSII